MESEAEDPDAEAEEPEDTGDSGDDGRKPKIRKKHRGRKVILVLLIAALAGGGYYGYRYYQNKKTAAAAAASMSTQVRTYTLAKGTLENSITADGTIASVNSTEVSTSLTYDVESVNVAVGDTVTEGQTIVTLDSSEIEKNLERSQKENQDSLDDMAKQLQNKLDAKNNAWDDLVTARNKGGDTTEADRKFASANGEYFDAQADYDEAVASGYASDKLKQTIEDYQEQISKCNVTATSSGTIVSLNATVGSPITSNSTIATIADTSDLKVSVSLDEYDIQKVTKGMKATVTTDAVDGTFNATVTSVSIASTTSSSSSSMSSSSSSSGYAVTVTLDDQTTSLLIGMNVKVTIIVSSDADVYTVPIDAVGQDSSGNSVIYVKQSDGTYSAMTVTTGDSNDYYIVVSGDGLSDGLVIRASADESSATVAQASASASSDSGLNLNLGGATGGGSGGGSAPQGGGGGGAPQGGGPGGN